MRGEIEGYEGTKLYVREMTPDNTAWMNDTLDVVDGKFCYRGKLQSPCLVYFVPENFRGRYELFLDNSKRFIEASDKFFSYSTLNKVKVFAPCAEFDKIQIVNYAIDNNVPLKLLKSCYQNSKQTGKKHCLECMSCKLLYNAIKNSKKPQLIKEIF